jgi:hypothetical protein
MAVIKRKHVQMNSRYRVSYVFIKAPDLKLIASVQNIIMCLTGNAAFASLTALLAELTAALAAFETIVAAKGLNQTRLLTAQRDQARETLLDVIRQTGASVESIAMESLSTLESSGFTARSKSKAQSQLVTPVILKASRFRTTQLLLRLTRINNAKLYETQFSTDGGKTWTSGSYSTQARRIILTNLVPGTVYLIQARAIGGSTGKSDWSSPISIMAT